MADLSRASRPLLVAALLVAALLGGLPLLSCSSGGIAEPVQDVVGDTYVMATITMLDTGDPCGPFICDPEMFECRSRQPIVVGQTWQLRGDVASAGMVSASNISIAATDLATKMGIALEFQLAGYSGLPLAALSTTASHTYADIDVECDHLTATGSESRFDYLGSGTVTLTAASVDGTRIVPAVPDGAGGFSPAGIFEGSFSFVGRALQPIPGDTLDGQVLVQGCFRVNVAALERSAPVTPNPTSPSPTCP